MANSGTDCGPVFTAMSRKNRISFSWWHFIATHHSTPLRWSGDCFYGLHLRSQNVNFMILLVSVQDTPNLKGWRFKKVWSVTNVSRLRLFFIFIRRAFLVCDPSLHVVFVEQEKKLKSHSSDTNLRCLLCFEWEKVKCYFRWQKRASQAYRAQNSCVISPPANSFREKYENKYFTHDSQVSYLVFSKCAR